MLETRGRGTGERYLNGEVRVSVSAELSGYWTLESRMH